MKYLPLLLILTLSLAATACHDPNAKPPSSTTEKTAMSSTANPTAQPDSPVTHTDAEWKKILSPKEYAVLRQKATDAPFTGQYDDFYQPGAYSCAACGQELFSSKTKFNAGCGWPAFLAAEAGDKVKLVPDYSHGTVRTEVLCARCGSHLGHLFTNETHEINGVEQKVSRYCINSTALKFTPDSSSEKK